MRYIIISIILLYTMSLEAKVTVNTASYQKIIKNGKKKWVKASIIVPNTTILYINTISNTSNNIAKELVIDNTIAKEISYIKYSAKSKLKSKITYSVNNGKSYHKPNRLYIKRKGKRVKAKASDYTNIRWTINQLKSKESTTVRYLAKLK